MRKKIKAPESSDVRRYYSEVGWRRGSSGEFVDTELTVARRRSYREYHAASYRRLRRHLDGQGILLDVGAGAVPHDEYARLYDGYDCVICLDVSFEGLSAARSRLNAQQCSFVVADARHLPFRPDKFTSILCAHLLYHMDSGDQQRCVSEFVHQLLPGGVLLVVYSRWATFLTMLARSRRAIASRRNSRLADNRRAGDQRLFFDPRPLSELLSEVPSDVVSTVTTWRVLDSSTAAALIPDNRVGDLFFKLLTLLETHAPKLLTRLARYPLIKLVRN